MENALIFFITGALFPLIVMAAWELMFGYTIRKVREYKALWRASEKHNTELQQRITRMRATSDTPRFMEVGNEQQ